MGYITQIVDKLLSVQDKFYPEAKEQMGSGEGKISLLRVVGLDGENLLLKVVDDRIKYANESDQPTDIFKCTTDTFLNVISNETTLREAITKGHFTIENAKTKQIDLIECEKWAQAFTKLHSVIEKSLKS